MSEEDKQFVKHFTGYRKTLELKLAAQHAVVEPRQHMVRSDPRAATGQ